MAGERFLLDSGVYDPLLDHPDVVAALLRLISSGRLALLVTHVQREQVRRGSDSARERHARRTALFERLLEVSEEVPAGIFLLDITPLDGGRWASDEQAAAFEAILRPQPVHLKARSGVACDTEETGRQRWTTHLDQVSCAECRSLLGLPWGDLLRYRDGADAVLIETARVEGATFVTKETSGRAPDAADRHGVPRLTVEQFFAWILSQS